MATSAILGCALMVMFGVCDFQTAFGQMASGTVIMLIGVMVTGAAVSECGLASYIGGIYSGFLCYRLSAFHLPDKRFRAGDIYSHRLLRCPIGGGRFTAQRGNSLGFGG